jgi:hypothetical protein
MDIQNKTKLIISLEILAVEHIKHLVSLFGGEDVSYTDIEEEDASYGLDNNPPSILNHIDFLVSFLVNEPKRTPILRLIMSVIKGDELTQFDEDMKFLSKAILSVCDSMIAGYNQPNYKKSLES